MADTECIVKLAELVRVLLALGDMPVSHEVRSFVRSRVRAELADIEAAVPTDQEA